MAELIALAGAALLSWRKRDKSATLWWMLMAWALAITLLLFPFSEIAWLLLPKLRFMQLPWRWLLCLNVIFALLFPLAWRRRVPRILICVAMLLVLAAGWLLVQPPWWEKTRDFSNALADQQSGKGYEGTDEYLPVASDAYDVKPEAPPVTLENDGKAQIRVQEWAAEEKSFTAEVSQPGNLVLHLFTYPAWMATVNGQGVETDNQDNTGQMLIPVDAGENRVRVSLIRTHDQVLGDGISAATVVCMLGWLGSSRGRRALRSKA
jgi:hypothetical protein